MKVIQKLNKTASARRFAGVALLAALALAGCGSSGPLERWQTSQDQAAPQPSAQAPEPGAKVQVVFFRTAAAQSAERPVNIYIDGHYQASLVGNTYTERALCQGSHSLAARMDDAKQAFAAKKDGHSIQLGAQAQAYYQVVQAADGSVALQAVDAAAVPAQSLKRLQTHTLSRLGVSDCAAS